MEIQPLVRLGLKTNSFSCVVLTNTADCSLRPAGMMNAPACVAAEAYSDHLFQGGQAQTGFPVTYGARVADPPCGGGVL